MTSFQVCAAWFACGAVFMNVLYIVVHFARIGGCHSNDPECIEHRARFHGPQPRGMITRGHAHRGSPPPIPDEFDARPIVADQSREVLREWRAASPAGPVVSRDAIWKAVLAVQMDGKEKGFLGADDAALDRACESFRKSGYFVV